MKLQDLKLKTPAQLLQLAESENIENASNMLKQEMIFAILKKQADKGEAILGEGVAEVLQDGFAFLRSPQANYLAGQDDIYVSPSQVRKFSLRTGDTVEGEIRAPKDGERYFSLLKVNKINFDDPEQIRHRINFDNLIPLYPDRRIKLEIENRPDKKDLSMRVADIVAPFGFGQRALINAQPRTGKTVFLQNIAHSITANHPDAYLIVLLIDERPEEVTDMQRTVKGEVVSSTFDEPATRHVQLAEMVIEKAKKLVEHKKDVVILLDSITRLARMDEVIFEEFKGTGNSEIILDRKIADKRTFPAIDITKSGTRKEDLLVDKPTLTKMWVMRKILAPMGAMDGIEFLLDKLGESKNNGEFFERMNS